MGTEEPTLERQSTMKKLGSAIGQLCTLVFAACKKKEKTKKPLSIVVE